MDNPPQTLSVNGAGIAPELKAVPQWLGWVWGLRKGRWTKIPRNARGDGPASSTNPATWTTYGVASRYAAQIRLPGLGLVLTHEAGIAFIDLDKCFQDGVLTEQAQEIVARCDSYTEWSPSGTGLHIFCYGTLPVHGARRGGIEIYQQGRFATITGQRLAGTPAEVRAAQSAIDAVLALAGGGTPDVPPHVWQPVPAPVGLRARAEQGRIRRDTLALLDSTGAGTYTSASEADSAIACGLISSGLSCEEAYAVLAESVRGSDMPRRKGTHAESYLRRTVAHAAEFATPAPLLVGTGVRHGSAAGVVRHLTQNTRNGG